jgi:hypothetical protein
MRSLTGTATGLRWSRPSVFRREFELRAGEELVATLTIRGAFRPVGTVESADGTWTFTRTGFFQNRGTIRARGGATNLAEFHSSVWNGASEVTFDSGRRYELAINLWRTRLEVRSESGEPLVIFHKRGWCGGFADVEIAPAARTMKELLLLVTYGWFHLVMLEQDAAAVVTG